MRSKRHGEATGSTGIRGDTQASCGLFRPQDDVVSANNFMDKTYKPDFFENFFVFVLTNVSA